MGELADTKRLEEGRLRLHEAVSRLLVTFKEVSPTMHWLEKRLRRNSAWCSDLLLSQLEQLEEPAAKPLEDKSYLELGPFRRDSDARRRWFLFALATLYEIGSGDGVRAYSDDGQRAGNAGAGFVCEVFTMLTGEKIPLSTVERVMRKSTKSFTFGVPVYRAAAQKEK